MQGDIAKQLVGAWRYVGTRIDGGNWDRGANPKGMIYYGRRARWRCRSRRMSNVRRPAR
jgi:hypothetical protein